MEAWLQLFPREQMCIIDANRMFTDPQPVMDSLAEFLGLGSAMPLSLGHVNGYPDIEVDPGVRADLAAHFAPHDERLEDLLGWRPSWR